MLGISRETTVALSADAKATVLALKAVQDQIGLVSTQLGVTEPAAAARGATEIEAALGSEALAAKATLAQMEGIALVLGTTMPEAAAVGGAKVAGIFEPRARSAWRSPRLAAFWLVCQRPTGLAGVIIPVYIAEQFIPAKDLSAGRISLATLLSASSTVCRLREVAQFGAFLVAGANPYPGASSAMQAGAAAHPGQWVNQQGQIVNAQGQVIQQPAILTDNDVWQAIMNKQLTPEGVKDRSRFVNEQQYQAALTFANTVSPTLPAYGNLPPGYYGSQVHLQLPGAIEYALTFAKPPGALRRPTLRPTTPTRTNWVRRA